MDALRAALTATSGSRTAGGLLSCRDKKVIKETLPGRSPLKIRAVPSAPHAAGHCATRAIAYSATRSDSARLTAPGCAPVLGELRRGKVNYEPEVSSHKSRLTLKSAINRNGGGSLDLHYVTMIRLIKAVKDKISKGKT